MKKILLIISLIFGGLVTSAQTTSVTATITDSDSQTWNNGTWEATLTNVANPNGPYYLDGVQLTTAQLQKSGSMSSSGVITGTFYDTVNHITPNGSVYLFTLCPNASAPCVSNIGASPTGSSINLSTTLSANLAAPRFAATGANKYGYLDAEISPTPVSGGVYYNVTTGFQRIWSGSAWSNNGSGAGGPPTGTAGGDLGGTYPNPTVANLAHGTGLTSAQIPNNAANTSGNAATATALAATPSACPANQATVAISANGTLTCATIPTLAGYTPVNPASAAITGGTIDNTAIGSTTPSTGSFTNVTDSGLTSGYFPVAGTGGLLGNSGLNYGVTQSGVVAIAANNVAFLLYDTGSGYSAVQTSVHSGSRYWQAGMRADSNTNCTGATNNVYDFFSGTAGADEAYLCESGLFNAGSLNIAGAVTLPGLTNADTGDYVCYNAGVIEYDATACVASLRALKRNISPIHGALAETMKLKPVEYRFKAEAHNSSGDQMHVGFIAEDVASVDQRLAGYNKKGELETVDYQHMTALLAAAVQEQQKEIRSLKREVARLEKKH